MLARLAFAVGLVCSAALAVGVWVSVLPVGYRFWPPGDDERKRRTYMGFTWGFLLATVATAVLSWGGGPLRWSARLAGAVVLVVGLAVTTRGGADLGEETKGHAGDLQTDGVYRYTRNPQVVGYLVTFAGLMLLADSRLVAGLVAAMLLWFPATVFAEEPWLREQYGEAYERYCEDVPRFVGVRTLRRLVAALR
jgi:protein-S-isoprenylcysteine O-methyltransferase Ste14